MKRKIKFPVYPLLVIVMGVFFVVGCSDDDTEPDSNIVTDIDSNEYKTVIIGNQEWMAENLRVTRYNNGDAILTGLGNADWTITKEGAYAIYDHHRPGAEGIHSPSYMVEAYGKLYNWHAVADARGLCPEGWQVPSDDDWTELIDYVVDQGFPNESTDPNGSGNALRSCRQIGSPHGEACNTSGHPRWNPPLEYADDHYGFDEFGFSALPAGYRASDGTFMSIGFLGLWWSSSDYNSSGSAWTRTIAHSHGALIRITSYGADGLSVRCFREVDN